MPTGCPRWTGGCTPDWVRASGARFWTMHTKRFCAALDLVELELPDDLDPDSEAADPYYARLPLDPYAAQDEAEFFAVSSEAFFVDPGRLRDAFPQWYELLSRFYRQDPLAT